MKYEEFCSYGDQIRYEDKSINDTYYWTILYKGSINIDNKNYFFILERHIEPELIRSHGMSFHDYITYKDITYVVEIVESEEKLEELLLGKYNEYKKYSNDELSIKAKEELEIPDLTASDLTTTIINFPDIFTKKDNIEINSAICKALFQEKQKEICIDRYTNLRHLISQNIDARERMIQYSQKIGINFTEEQIDLALKYEKLIIDCILYGKYNWIDYKVFINSLPEVVLRKEIYVNRGVLGNVLMGDDQEFLFKDRYSGERLYHDYYDLKYQERTDDRNAFMKYSLFFEKMHSIDFRQNRDRKKLDTYKILTKEELVKMCPECSGENPYYVIIKEKGFKHFYWGISYNEDGIFQLDRYDSKSINNDEGR